MDMADYDAAISLFEEAAHESSALDFSDGIALAAAGIADAEERIILAKRAQAEDFLSQGYDHFTYSHYAEAIACFEAAMEIYEELDDDEGIYYSRARITLVEVMIAHWEAMDAQQNNDGPDAGEPGGSAGATETPDAPDAPDAPDGPYPPVAPDSNEPLSNYDHNRSISFDLGTFIDNQNRGLASQVRMGGSDGRNEGWYNGCGWIAAYNALIIMGDPLHPAEIVNHFETSGGTVFDGVLGTYPHAIERFFRDRGYEVRHTLFPGITTNVDNAIRGGSVGILAFMHTSAAHFVTIEYREEDDRFIVYNDSFARRRSQSLGFESDQHLGAAIDSVQALVRNTSEILFTFSLIIIS